MLTFRRASPSPRHLWLAVAVGSVALLLIAARRRRRANAPEPIACDDAPPAGAEPAREEPLSKPAALDAKPESPAPLPERFVCKVAPYSIELPLPAVHRAALAITLGKPAALRRLAHDLQRLGQDVEAGLLENYAILLERCNPDRNRLVTEVTRMLRAAVAERRSARRTTPAIAWPPTGLGGAAREPGPAPTPDAAPMPDAAPKTDTAPKTEAPKTEAPPPGPDTATARGSNAVALLPLVTVDAVTVAARRRASR